MCISSTFLGHYSLLHILMYVCPKFSMHVCIIIIMYVCKYACMYYMFVCLRMLLSGCAACSIITSIFHAVLFRRSNSTTAMEAVFLFSSENIFQSAYIHAYIHKYVRTYMHAYTYVLPKLYTCMLFVLCIFKFSICINCVCVCTYICM